MSETHPFDYAERDLPYRKVAIWSFGLFFSIIVVMGLMWALFGAPGTPIDPKAVLNRSMTQPPLQPRPWVDLKEFRKQQNLHLSTYGWVDKNAGVVRIPIERAIELTSERGLPARGVAQGQK